MRYINIILAVSASLFISFSDASPAKIEVQRRADPISAQAAKALLIPIPAATQFCVNYLKGQTPPQSTTTLSTSTQTVTSTPLTTTTTTTTSKATVTTTAVVTSTPLTTTTSTAQASTVTSYQSTSTSTVTVTTTVSQDYTSTISRGAGRRAVETDVALVSRAAEPFAAVLALPANTIKDGCFLYLYGTTQYPTKTVTPSPKTGEYAAI